MKKLIDAYVYRINKDSEPEFLLLLRSSKKIYANQWRMIGGKVQNDEHYWQAALRELKEETGVLPKRFWTVPSINTFYEAKTDQIHQIPAFAAEIDVDTEIYLDDEHIDFKWISVDNLEVYLYWPEQIRLIRLVHHILTNKKILPEWVIEID